MTDAEHRLWYHLRGRRFGQRKFRRQVPLGDYIVDFLCEEARLVVELDGGQHASQHAYDDARTAWLNKRGYSVLRFWNNDVLGNTEGVLEEIAATLTPPSPKGEGERPSPRPLPRERET